MSAGYSGTPLLKKLGIKSGHRVIAIQCPCDYLQLLGEFPEDAKLLKRLGSSMDVIHLFVRRRTELQRQFLRCKQALAENGMLWVSWPKKTSSLASDISEADVRKHGLNQGLVDIKICAVDHDWSGLKFVYRLADRGGRKTAGK